MCSPAIASLVITAFSAASSYQQGEDQKRALNTQAMAEDAAAQRAAEADSVVAGRTLQRGREIIAKQTAMAGASGADVGSQSFGNVMASTSGEVAFDAATEQMNYLREAWGLTQKAAGSRANASLAGSKGLFDAAGTALSGWGQASGQALQAGGGKTYKWT